MLVDGYYRDRYSGQRSSPWAWPRLLLRLRALAWLDTAALAAAVQTFALTRVLLLGVTYLAMALHPAVWGHGHPSSATFWDAWYQWDARWYVRVARSGYHWHDLDHWSSVAFFPFYPLLILGLVTVLPLSTKLVALAVSNALFFVALYFLHRLVGRECGREIAKRTVLYLAIFPTALFFFAGYSESAYLLCAVLAMGAMRRNRWAAAGLWGCLAAATRSQGLVLLVPFAVELWQAYGPDWRVARRWLWMSLIPVAWILLAIFMAIKFAHPYLFIQAQQAWHRTTAWPWEGLWGTLQRIDVSHIASPTGAHNLIELICVVGFAGLIAAGWRILPRSFSFYSLGSLLLILFNPAILHAYYLPLMSASRLCLAIFPAFITLATLGRQEFADRLVTSLGPALLGLFTVVFLQGAWVA